MKRDLNKVSTLSNEELMAQTEDLAKEEKAITADLLVFLREVEKRFLFSERGFSSMFDFMTRGLGYENSCAFRRLSSMRMMKEQPQVEEKIRRGDLSLSNVAAASTFFNHAAKNDAPLSKEEKAKVLKNLEGLSTREAEKELLALTPNPEPLKHQDKIKPVTEELSEIKFLAPQALVDQLKEIRALLAHVNPNFTLAELIAKVAGIAQAELMRKRIGSEKRAMKMKESEIKKLEMKKKKTEASKPAVNQGVDANQGAGENTIAAGAGTHPAKAQPKKRTRYISVPVRRAVFERDGHSCCYEDPVTKRKCGSVFGLELDHGKVPFARGGESSVENLRIACKFHNRLNSYKNYGRKKIDRYCKTSS